MRLSVLPTHISVYTMCVPCALRDKKNISDPLELVLLMVPSCPVGVGNEPLSSARAASALDCCAPFSLPLVINCVLGLQCARQELHL